MHRCHHCICRPSRSVARPISSHAQQLPKPAMRQQTYALQRTNQRSPRAAKTYISRRHRRDHNSTTGRPTHASTSAQATQHGDTGRQRRRELYYQNLGVIVVHRCLALSGSAPRQLVSFLCKLLLFGLYSSLSVSFVRLQRTCLQRVR